MIDYSDAANQRLSHMLRDEIRSMDRPQNRFRHQTPPQQADGFTIERDVDVYGNVCGDADRTIATIARRPLGGFSISRFKKLILSSVFTSVSSVVFCGQALAQRAGDAANAVQSGNNTDAGFDLGAIVLSPSVVAGVGAAALTLAAIAWALRAHGAARSASTVWSGKLAEMEARLEKADAVLSAHPGLVLVWDDDFDAIENGWGSPKILGGPAALASLMSFSTEALAQRPADAPSPDGDAKATVDDHDKSVSPIDRLLNALGELPLEEEGVESDARKLREKVRDLRTHGIAFSGSVYTSEGRAIEADGRVAGGQVALWLTDPAVRMAEDGGIVGRVRENAVNLHGALSQLERAPLPAWRRDSSMKLTWVNAAYAETVEAPSIAVVLKEQIELESSVRQIAERAAGDRRSVEGRIAINVGGVRRVYRISETPTHSAGEAAICGFAIDVTDLEATRTDLSQHIEANRRTLDQIPSAVGLFGANQELAYYNEAFRALWELGAAELDARPGHGELLDRLRHAGRLPEQADYRAWRKEQLALYTDGMDAPGVERDGAAPDDVWFLPDGRTLRVARTRHPLGGVLVLFEDITEKLRMEARFNTQIKVQRATLDNLSEGVATFAANGVLDLYNQAFARLWRLDDALLSSRPHIEKLMDAMMGRIDEGEEKLGAVRQRITSMNAEDREPLREAVLSLADGRTLVFGAEPLPDGATLVYFHDITDSKEREKELKERNAFLEDIDRQKSKFVDHVSYQLRTPLNTIIGFSEMIDGQMFGVLNDRQKDYVASVLSAAYSLKDLISDIMDLAAIDAGKLALEREDVDLRDLLTNAATYAALKAEDTQVALDVECPKDIGSIHADGRRLKQVLFNLLSNAFAYTGAGGDVKLGAERVPGMVRIWVEDSGRGVSPEDQAKIFEAFESSGPSAGAGLGLALVQRFVTLHGGWVRMDSKPDEGTRITCFLPTDASSGAALAPPTPAQDETTDDTSSGVDAGQTTGSTPKKRRTRKKAVHPETSPAQKTGSTGDATTGSRSRGTRRPVRGKAAE